MTTDKLYSCPYTENSISYKNMCPVVGCHANIATLNKPSGCVHNYLGGKPDLDEIDLAYVFGLPIEFIKTQAEEGRKATRKVLLLQTVLERLRGTTKDNCCPECGVPKSSRGKCLNKTNCDTRKLICEGILNRSPLKITELNATKSDIYLLLNNLDKIKQFMAQKLNKDSVKANSLIGMTNGEVEALRNLMIKKA